MKGETMKQSEFIKMLITAHDVPNCYNNRFPKNLGYYDGSKWSFDCWNLIKVVLSGWQPKAEKGYYIHPQNLVTGDIDGKTMLNRCYDRSKDFRKLKKQGTYLYLESSPHSGIYVGDFTLGGKVYNVIECTKNNTFNANGVTYTYVDEQGNRRRYKGGAKSLAWSEYGLFPSDWLTYEDTPYPLPSDEVYTLEEFRTDVKNILGAVSNEDAFNKTIKISTLWNKNNALVTPLERYFKALNYYSGEIEADNGKKTCFGGGMKSATMLYQRYVVKPAKAKDIDGVLDRKGATWKKLLLG